jgi:hypothetical protein
MTTISVSYQVDGTREWGAKLEELVLRLADATYTATRDGLHTIEAAEKTLLSLFSHPPGTPTPSPPGSPVGLITGHLRRGVNVDGPWQLSLFEVEGSVGPTAVYARIQELGGFTGKGHTTYLPPRPYHQPTIDAVLPQVYQGYADAWARAIHDTLHSGG